MSEFHKKPRWQNKDSGRVSFTVEEMARARAGDSIVLHHAFKGFVLARVTITESMLANATKMEAVNKDTFYLVNYKSG
jgi:hypothetical protein